MFFKRQTGIENHTKQLDGFGEVNVRPETSIPLDRRSCGGCLRVPNTTASVLSGFKSKAFSTNHLDTSTAQISMADRSLKSSKTYIAVGHLRTDDKKCYAGR